MSMISYAAGTRYLSLIGGVPLSFYDWYCDLPPSSPQVWGEQTDVLESADWYNSGFIIVWGGNVPQTRSPDAHFFTEVQYKGTKIIVISPDYSEAAKFADLWIPIKQGTDSALAMSMGHIILKEYYLSNKTSYFIDYVKKYTDLPCLLIIEKNKNHYTPGRYLRASDIKEHSEKKNSDWKTLIYDEKNKKIEILEGSIGFRWDNSGLWNLKNSKNYSPKLTFSDDYDDILEISFPYFAGKSYNHKTFKKTNHENFFKKKIPVKKIISKQKNYYISTVFDILIGSYGLDHLSNNNIISDYKDNVPYTPLWQKNITGIDENDLITLTRQFAENAKKTLGKSLIITGAGVNHWYNMDMSYRGMINILILCGCIGVSGGGWAHYVGQEN
jgi:nitrate reductase alpha subunit